MGNDYQIIKSEPLTNFGFYFFTGKRSDLINYLGRSINGLVSNAWQKCVKEKPLGCVTKVWTVAILIHQLHTESQQHRYT